MPLIGVFGGTFDPVHCGHLRTLIELRDLIVLDEVVVVPCGLPPHRVAAPVAPAEARVRMLAAALGDLDRVTVDCREIDRPGPSYTFDTLASLREERGDSTLCLLMGSDAFIGLPGWHRWRELTELCHIVVARRPGSAPTLPDGLALWLESARAKLKDLKASRAGRVVFCETSQLEVSSSHLRGLAAARRSLRWLVPEVVEQLIEDNGWYRVRT